MSQMASRALLGVGRDDDAFARGEAVSFDHDRIMQILDETTGLLAVVEDPCHRRRHSSATHDLFRKNFGCFQARGRFRGTENP